MNKEWSVVTKKLIIDGCLLALTLATSVSYVSLFVWLEIHCCSSTASSTHCQIVSTPSSRVPAGCQFILSIKKHRVKGYKQMKTPDKGKLSYETLFTLYNHILIACNVTQEMGTNLKGDQIVRYLTSQWSEIEKLGFPTSTYLSCWDSQILY